MMTDLRAGAESMKQTILPHNGDKKPSEENSMRPPKNTFSIALSREEIEADFTAITGAKPPRKPKKRPRAIQRKFDDLFPGSSLMEVTPDKYKFPETANH